MATTQDVLDRCADLANAAFPKSGGACNARDAAIYLAHTDKGESLRALAAATGTHPSTVMRAVRRVEARRDDPIVDSMITDLEDRSGRRPETDPLSRDIDPAPDAARPEASAPPAIPKRLAPAELERAARRYLRRLCEPGSFLLVTPEATKGGVFCKANDFRKPIAMLAVGLAVEFLREGWIRVFRRGTASIRYRVTEDGRSYLRRLLAADAVKRLPGTGFADGASPFLAQHQIAGERTVPDPATGMARRIKVNLGEDPLGWLARRKGADGRPFLGPGEIDAGERLRQDFEAAQLGPSVAQDWRRFLTPGGRMSGTPLQRGPAGGPAAARDRVADALTALGPGLSDAALRVCCFLEGLEACERRMGWSARSGKVVLKIALQRLTEHYGMAPGRGRQDRE